MRTMFAHWQYTCLIPLLCLFACIKDQDASVENLLVINVDQDNAIAAWSYREKWTKNSESPLVHYCRCIWQAII